MSIMSPNAQKLLEDALRLPDSDRGDLAALLIEHAARPAQALKLLRAVPPGKLNPQEEAKRARLEQIAQQQVDDGSLELSEDW